MPRRVRLGAFGTALLWLSLAYVVAEACLRLAQGGCYTYLPYRRSGGFPMLPPASTFCFVNSERAHVLYVTDAEGARRRTRSEAALPCKGCVMAIGDSQALGYGIPYDAAFTAQYAAHENRQSVIVAAPADDPGTERLAAAHYVAATGSVPNTVFVVVNFGNDVDELYVARHNTGTKASGASSWLPEHSFVYADLAIMWRALGRRFAPAAGSIPPGTNPVAYAVKPGQAPLFAAEVTRDVVAIIRETGARTAVAVLIPPDDLVDPSEFQKYRRYYSADDFALWRSRLPYMSAVMRSIQDAVGSQLRARAIPVLDARPILARVPGVLAFDRRSQHLTPLANRMIATALVQLEASRHP